MKTIVILFFLATFSTFYHQNNFDYKRERRNFIISLIENSKENKIVTKKIDDDKMFEGRYLGIVKSKSGNINFVITFSYVFNLKRSPTAENFIFFFNSKKQYVGNYYLNQRLELPDRLSRNTMYFKNDECLEKQQIKLYYGIPRVINLKCNGQNNYYEFKND